MSDIGQRLFCKTISNRITARVILLAARLF